MNRAKALLVGAVASIAFIAPTALHTAVASAQAPPCAITSASVNAATAMFTVGSAGCTGTVGPISFSTYELPNGKVLPYNKQVAIAHHPSNGASYGEGTYTLTLTLNGAKCWQSDLYYGTTVVTPPHPHTIAVDYQQGQCTATDIDTPVVPTTVPETAVPTVPTTAPETACVLGPDGHYSFAGTNIPCEGPVPTTEAPPTTPVVTGGLPATGRGTTLAVFALLLLTAGVTMVLIGLVRRESS